MLKNLESAIDQFIQSNFVTRKVKFSENLVFEIKTLSAEERLEARQRIPQQAKSDMLLYSQFEARNFLAYSITSINGENIENTLREDPEMKDLTSADLKTKKAVYVSKILGSLPAAVVSSLSEEFNNLTSFQNEQIEKDYAGVVENF